MSEKAVMDELMGLEGVTMQQLDRPAEQGPSPAEVMQVLPPKPSLVPKAQQMDARHSIRSGGDGYLVTVAGTYYVRATDGKSKDLRNYTLQFRLPHLYDPKTGKGALGIIVGKLLMAALVKHYPGAIGYRTHEIIDAKPLTPTTPPVDNLQYMDLPQLQAYAQTIGFPFDPNEYWDAVHLREDVLDFKSAPKDFAKRRKARHDARLEEKELLDLNPDLREKPLALPTVTPAAKDSAEEAIANL